MVRSSRLIINYLMIIFIFFARVFPDASTEANKEQHNTNANTKGCNRLYNAGIDSILFASKLPANRPAIMLPIEYVNTNSPIIWPLKRFGDSLLTALRATGLKQSSPTV